MGAANSHRPAQVSTAPTQRHDAAPHPQYTLLHGLWQDWDYDGCCLFVADLIFQRVGQNSLHVVLLSKTYFVRSKTK